MAATAGNLLIITGLVMTIVGTFFAPVFGIPPLSVTINSINPSVFDFGCIGNKQIYLIKSGNTNVNFQTITLRFYVINYTNINTRSVSVGGTSLSSSLVYDSNLGEWYISAASYSLSPSVATSYTATFTDAMGASDTFSGTITYQISASDILFTSYLDNAIIGGSSDVPPSSMATSIDILAGTTHTLKVVIRSGASFVTGVSAFFTKDGVTWNPPGGSGGIAQFTKSSDGTTYTYSLAFPAGKYIVSGSMTMTGGTGPVPFSLMGIVGGDLLNLSLNWLNLLGVLVVVAGVIANRRES
jgi:hypothetical protein